MAMQIVTYDPEKLEPGKFYWLQLNKDQAPAFIEAPIQPTIAFTNLQYLEVPYDGRSSFHVWEVLQDSGIEYSEEITSSIQVGRRKKNGETLLILKSNRLIPKGFIQFS